MNSVETARVQGYAYVWGRQDAGEAPRDTGCSIQFGDAFALRQQAYDSELTWTMVPLLSAWREWSATGRLTYRTRDGWREITVIPAGADQRVIDRAASDSPVDQFV